MKYHLSPSAQQAKDTAFNRNLPCKNVGDSVFNSTQSPSLASPYRPHSSGHISPLQLLLLSFVLTTLLVFLVSLIIHNHLQQSYNPATENLDGVRKLRKRRPSCFNLNGDVEAQRSGSGSRNSFDLSGDESGGEMGEILEGTGVASGVDVKGLTPSALLSRTRADSAGWAAIGKVGQVL